MGTDLQSKSSVPMDNAPLLENSHYNERPTYRDLTCASQLTLARRTTGKPKLLHDHVWNGTKQYMLWTSPNAFYHFFLKSSTRTNADIKDMSGLAFHSITRHYRHSTLATMNHVQLEQVQHKNSTTRQIWTTMKDPTIVNSRKQKKTDADVQYTHTATWQK